MTDAEIADSTEWRGRGQAAGLTMRDIEVLDPSQEAKCENYLPELRAVLADLVKAQTWNDIEKRLVKFRREHKFAPKKNVLWHLYQEQDQRNPVLEKLLVTKGMRSLSGVLVVTVLTSAYPVYTDEEGVRRTQRFSCKHNCYYCPSEPAHAGNNWVPQPRSYLHDEPGVLRANQNGFDAVLQFRDRIATYLANGHPIDKVELLVLGGTWSEYPHAYQREFVRDLFYAANTTFSERKERRSLEEEVKENATTAQVRIIGLTLETRPDSIDADEVRRLREYHCTRVQLGVQHTNEDILRTVNRGHGVKEVKTALKLLKDNCFKVDIHLMPMLPGATVQADAAMFQEVLTEPDLQADQWKIYPCSVVPWTRIEKWFKDGTYRPYDDLTGLLPLLLRTKASVHPWIRLNRVVRDIPSTYITGGCGMPNMRQSLLERIRDSGVRCKCIRCREVKGRDFINPTFKVRRYLASGGIEYFLSFESADETVLYGFLRLRIPSLDGLPDDAGTGLSGLVSEAEVAPALAIGDRRDQKQAAIAARKFQREVVRGRAKMAAAAARKDDADIAHFAEEQVGEEGVENGQGYGNGEETAAAAAAAEPAAAAAAGENGNDHLAGAAAAAGVGSEVAPQENGEEACEIDVAAAMASFEAAAFEAAASGPPHVHNNNSDLSPRRSPKRRKRSAAKKASSRAAGPSVEKLKKFHRPWSTDPDLPDVEDDSRTAADHAAAVSAVTACSGGWLGLVGRALRRRRVEKGVMPELRGCALIRELHVYGQLRKVGEIGAATQHRGLGARLLAEAEKLALRHGYWRTAVISGVGVRRYYEKFGYRLCGRFHIKELVDLKRWAAVAAAAAAAAAAALAVVMRRPRLR